MPAIADRSAVPATDPAVAPCRSDVIESSSLSEERVEFTKAVAETGWYASRRRYSPCEGRKNLRKPKRFLSDAPLRSDSSVRTFRPVQGVDLFEPVRSQISSRRVRAWVAAGKPVPRTASRGSRGDFGIHGGQMNGWGARRGTAIWSCRRSMWMRTACLRRYGFGSSLRRDPWISARATTFWQGWRSMCDAAVRSSTA